MIRRKPAPRRPERVHVVANHLIRANEVRVLDDTGKMIGVMTTRDALQRAQEEEKDLVLVNDQQTPPITKIIDLAKYKYQLQQKEGESRKKSKAQDTKEIRLTPFMSDGDFESRLKRIEEFLTRGDKVRLSVTFKGRQITKKEFGENMIARAITATQEYAVIEFEPKMIGKKLFCQLMPKKHS